MFIKGIFGKAIKNSRGEKSIEIFLETYHGRFFCSAPSGKSKGKHEVPALNEKGFSESMRLFNILCNSLKHKNIFIKDFGELKKIYSLIKKFESRRGRIGGNFSYALEGVFLKAAAKEQEKEVWEFVYDFNFSKNRQRKKFPMPVGNCIGGGLHSSKFSRKGRVPDFQEFLIIPEEKSFVKAVTKLVRSYDYCKRLLKKRESRWKVRKNDENAWVSSMRNESVLKVLEEVKKKFGVRIGLDVASSSFYDKGYYKYKNKELTRDKIEQAEFMERIVKDYGIFYLEDPMQEDDFSGFLEIANSMQDEFLSGKVLIVGDDLTTTNLARVRRAVNSKSINALIVKPNQCGSIYELIEVVNFCKENNIKTIFSHRSGETMDNLIADLAFGFQADFVKFGAFGKERLIKLKGLMDIEKGLKR